LGFYDASLIYEKGLDSKFDCVVVVAVDEGTQKKRLMARSSMSPQEAQQRIQAQMPLSQKIERAHFVISNNGSLDETLTARDMINASLREVLDKATDSWGVKVTRVEVQKIDPPEDITNAMSKQMKAEREKRATILEAEGEKTSKILRAEGDRQSEILKAEGAAQAVVLKADAEARAVEQVSTAAEKYFKDNAQILKRLDVLHTTLATNTKVILPTNAPILNLLGLDGQNLDSAFVMPKAKDPKKSNEV
jgi:regulator of protease activity HflC (stomatin/prohibitin superfamily)